jgi:hypothetical protein
MVSGEAGPGLSPPAELLSGVIARRGISGGFRAYRDSLLAASRNKEISQLNLHAWPLRAGSLVPDAAAFVVEPSLKGGSVVDEDCSSCSIV